MRTHKVTDLRTGLIHPKRDARTGRFITRKEASYRVRGADVAWNRSERFVHLGRVILWNHRAVR